MKKIFQGIMLLAVAAIAPLAAWAEVDVAVHFNIPLPPAIIFPVPPALVVIPETYVYAAPDVHEDIFFYNGWWWRPWQGRWYRSRSYNSGWAYYRNVPSFYSAIPSGWRNDYREHRWKGHHWEYQRIPQRELENNWRGWERKKHWENQSYWGVRGMGARPQEFRQMRAPEPQKSGPQFREGRPPSREGEHRGFREQHPERDFHGNHER